MTALVIGAVNPDRIHARRTHLADGDLLNVLHQESSNSRCQPRILYKLTRVPFCVGDGFFDLRGQRR
jgi:hypothetical protein